MSTPTDIAGYIGRQTEAKRADLEALDALIRRAAPRFTPFMAGTMIGYGKYHYRYATGREGDSCRIGLASTAAGFSLYICAIDESGQYIAESAKAKLGKVSVGKSCIRFKRVADLDLKGLIEIVKKTTKLPAPGETAADVQRAAKKKTGLAKRTTPASVKKQASKKKTGSA